MNKMFKNFLKSFFLFSASIYSITYEIYIEDWATQCSTTNACGSYFPTCHFAWDGNGVCTIAFASMGYNPSNANAGVIYGLTQNKTTIQNTVSLVHASYSGGAKIKLAYGGANAAYQLWAISNWQNSDTILNVAKNMTSACVGFGFDGIDIDFEAGPPAGAGLATAQLIKNIRSLFDNSGHQDKILTLTIGAQTLNSSFPEHYSLIKNLQNSDGSLGYVNHINFMEYCLGIAKGNNIIQQAQADIQSYHTGEFQLPYNKMAVGMEQYCCAVTSCSVGEFAMDKDSAASLTTWANNTGLAGVFWWDLNKELEYFTPSYCTMTPPPAAFPVSYAIKYACSQPPQKLMVGAALKTKNITSLSSNPPFGFQEKNRQEGDNSPSGAPSNTPVSR
jgi:chitinase